MSMESIKMNNPRVLFVLYYQSPPHTDDLIQRAREELKDLPYARVRGDGPPAETFNRAMKDLINTDWVVPFDPHLRWEDGGVRQFMEDLAKADNDPRVGYVSYPVYQHGPQVRCKDWIGSPQYAFFRLLAAFRVDALKSCGGFTAASSGRNWMWRTEMAIMDQGWRHLDSGVCVASHLDPDLTLQYHLQQTFMAGRDAADLNLRARGHPLIHEGTVQLVNKVMLMRKRNWDNVYWQCRELLRLLGAGEALGLLPKEPVQMATLQLRVHEDLEEVKE